MKKKHYLPEESEISSNQNTDKDQINEPVATYGMEPKIRFSPPLTEDELENAITGDELLEYIFEQIDKLPGK